MKYKYNSRQYWLMLNPVWVGFYLFFFKNVIKKINPENLERQDFVK